MAPGGFAGHFDSVRARRPGRGDDLGQVEEGVGDGGIGSRQRPSTLEAGSQVHADREDSLDRQSGRLDSGLRRPSDLRLLWQFWPGDLRPGWSGTVAKADGSVPGRVWCQQFAGVGRRPVGPEPGPRHRLFPDRDQPGQRKDGVEDVSPGSDSQLFDSDRLGQWQRAGVGGGWCVEDDGIRDQDGSAVVVGPWSISDCRHHPGDDLEAALHGVVDAWG